MKLEMLLLAGAVVCGCHSEVKNDFIVDSDFENYSFIIWNSDSAKKAEQGILPEPMYSFDDSNYLTRSFEGRTVEIRTLIARSISEEPALKYVSGKLEDLAGSYCGSKGDSAGDEYSMLPDPVSLAQKVVDMFHKDISIDAGNGEYSTMFESFEYFKFQDFSGRTVKIRRPFGQSIQTLSEFLNEKDGYKGKYVGDCDDFSMALLSCYEISRNMAYEKRNLSDFWSRLYDGLKRYQIFVIEVERDGRQHSLNMSVSYNEDFSEATISPIEPQCFYKSRGVCYKVDLRRLVGRRDKLLFLEIKNVLFSKEIMWHKVYRIFNSKVSYEYVRCSNEE